MLSPSLENPSFSSVIDSPQLDLSIVVPIYNEAESIETLVQAIADAVVEIDLSYEIIWLKEEQILRLSSYVVTMVKLQRWLRDLNLLGEK